VQRHYSGGATSIGRQFKVVWKELEAEVFEGFIKSLNVSKTCIKQRDGTPDIKLETDSQ